MQTDRAAVLFDIGPGAVGKLQQAIEFWRLDAIVISHMHADHFFDLVQLRYGLKYGGMSDRRSLLPLWLPPGGRAALEALRAAVSLDASADFFESVYAIEEYDPRNALDVNDLRLRFCRTRHYIEAYAARAECGESSITYSSDTAPCDAVVDLARETGVFLCEAGLGLGTEHGTRGHSSVEEAVEMARRAAVRRLVLTHYHDADPSALIQVAKSRFSGPVVAAEDGMEIAL